MKQLLQNVSTGDLTVNEVPRPNRSAASLLVANRYSLISAGTERAVLALGRASLVSKARARPDLARQVVQSVRTEGMSATYAKVRGRLGDPNALGYSSSGVVLESCDGAPATRGELVACAGAGIAMHAEIVSVPRTLCARVPDGVKPEEATYATVSSIALHGVRLAEVGLGDVAAVIGLGLVGQLTLELLTAAGCVPLGLDPDPRRVELARALGVFATSDPGELEAETRRLTGRRGADGVLVTAASKSASPLATATAVARERAVVCIVGDVAIESPRAPLFSKELRLVVSRSYGPGRYDPVYEEQGIDYPAGYVRWTEGRNLAEVLRLMASGQLNPARLTTHTFDIDDGPAAYGVLEADEPSLGILLRYPPNGEAGSQTVLLDHGRKSIRRAPNASLRIGFIGAGLFARSVLLPSLQRRAEIAAIATATGVSARATAQRFGAGLATTDPNAVLEADDIDAVVIATRHESHAEYAVRALEAGKHVFVEKPLALDEAELERVERAAASSSGILMVGFNRRFAPLAREMKDAIAARGPLLAIFRVNAGRLSANHWTHDPAVGGGRIVGEVCHFIDFCDYLCGAGSTASCVAAVSGSSEPVEDNVAATLRYADGSVCVIVYTALGDPGLAKERVEVMGESGAAVLDDFRELTVFRGGRGETKSGRRDKGHDAELATFVQACKDGRQPWPLAEMTAVTRVSFAIRDAVQGRR